MARCWMLMVMILPVSADNPRCSPPIPGVIVGINENVRKFANVTSVPTCCSLCAATDHCVAFNVHNNACRLHNQSVPVVNASGSISGKLLGSPGKSCATRSGVVFGAGNNLGGGKDAVFPEECCAACRANKACKAWNFHLNTKQCHLHTQTTPIRSDSTSISGVPSGALPPPPPLPPQPGQYTTGYACTAPDAAKKFKFCDGTLGHEARLDDLVPRINLADAGAQLTARQSPNLTDIGQLPSYYWGTNAIHGVQNVKCLVNGSCPTSFPAPCALAATFNMTNVHTMGKIIGRELRAYYNGRIHNSLDTWSPTININRDPRWGRNVESPGEDPFLNGLYGSAYAQGLQAQEDEDTQGVLQAVVTLKHWLAYSVERYDNVTRTNGDFNVSAYDLAATYMPAWKATVQGGGALGIMCSYNMVNGVPTCGNPALNRTLREDWGFKGYITSDSDSCASIHNPYPKGHGYEPSAFLATRDCLLGGTDIDSGRTYEESLLLSVSGGNVSRHAVDLALRNTYRLRMRLGLFDPHTDNKYKHISTQEVGSQASNLASLEAARQSMVLLKNEGNTLPFNLEMREEKGGKGPTVAIIGQSVTDTEGYLTGNYNGPLCQDKSHCFPTIAEEISRLNANGQTFNTSKVSSPSDRQSAVELASKSDFVVLVVDNAKDGGGEGHDRYTVGLSEEQIQLCEAVLQTNKTTVLVLVNGGAISIDSLKDRFTAIVEAFMPGVHGATAIAETVFGLNNPGGKLPVTIYHSSIVNQTDFLSMDMHNGPGRSYKYYTGQPLFPFGFGLSYTTFTLKWSPAPPPTGHTLRVAPPPPSGHIPRVHTGNTPGVDTALATNITYTVEVTNTGSRAGDEVVLAFFKPVLIAGVDTSDDEAMASVHNLGPSPKKQLFAFKRVHLTPGASTTLRFSVSPNQLSLVGLNGHHMLLDRSEYEVVFSRGHGIELKSRVMMDVDEGLHVVSRFRKWWN